MAGSSDSQILDYFERIMKDFVIERLSKTDGWVEKCIPPEIREHMTQRHDKAKKIDDLLNKPQYDVIQYINFDAYERIISRKDNWREYFEDIFLDRMIFSYKMQILLSLRNDIRHGRQLNGVNRLRLRLHCYDILAQVHESGMQGTDDHDALFDKLGMPESL